MKKKNSNDSGSIKTRSSKSNPEEENEKKFPGYPSYPKNDDLYARSKEKRDLDLENPQEKKSPNSPPDQPNHRDSSSDHSGVDLDIPGAELDDRQEALGAKDEENNHYSLGVDEKENLEEDQGDKIPSS